MGYSLEAYYPIDQKEVKQYIIENNIDVNDWEQCRIIASHFYEKITGESCEHLNIIYLYRKSSYYDEDDEDIPDDEDDEKRHVLYEYHQCNYIRDHDVLDINNPKRSELPEDLQGCIFNIHRPENAIDVAKAIREYFPDNEENEDVYYFADWLEKTSKFCYKYKLSM